VTPHRGHRVIPPVLLVAVVADVAVDLVAIVTSLVNVLVVDVHGGRMGVTTPPSRTPRGVTPASRRRGRW
jgi:hypothetical protein